MTVRNPSIRRLLWLKSQIYCLGLFRDQCYKWINRIRPLPKIRRSKVVGESVRFNKLLSLLLQLMNFIRPKLLHSGLWCYENIQLPQACAASFSSGNRSHLHEFDKNSNCFTNHSAFILFHSRLLFGTDYSNDAPHRRCSCWSRLECRYFLLGHGNIITSCREIRLYSDHVPSHMRACLSCFAWRYCIFELFIWTSWHLFSCRPRHWYYGVRAVGWRIASVLQIDGLTAVDPLTCQWSREGRIRHVYF